MPELIPTESEIPDPYVDIAPKLRPEESVDEGEPFRKQVIAGGASSAVAQMEIFNAEASVSNIAEMQNKADILKINLKAYEDKKNIKKYTMNFME